MTRTMPTIFVIAACFVGCADEEDQSESDTRRQSQHNHSGGKKSERKSVSKSTPKERPQTSAAMILAAGGKHWSSSESDSVTKGVALVSIWPAADRPLRRENGRLGAELRWSCRSGEALPKALLKNAFAVLGDKAHVGVVAVRNQNDTEGTLHIDFGTPFLTKDLSTAVVFFSEKFYPNKTVTNFIRWKLR